VSSVPVHPVEQEISLRFDRVSFSYSSSFSTFSANEAKVLENASFHVHRGEFVALVGPNGSGKTTVLKLILGLETPKKGTVQIFGETGRRALGKVGYVPQQPQLDKAFPITVREVVKMGCLSSLSRTYRAEDRAAVAEALEQAEIADLATRPYAALSGGQRRRVLVARALAARPGLLILDEPTANMDAESEERLYKTLGKLKGAATVLMVTHDTDFVSSLTDRVLCMGMNSGGNRYTIVQHPIEASAEIHGMGAARIVHGESLPADSCFDEHGARA